MTLIMDNWLKEVDNLNEYLDRIERMKGKAKRREMEVWHKVFNEVVRRYPREKVTP